MGSVTFFCFSSVKLTTFVKLLENFQNLVFSYYKIGKKKTSVLTPPPHDSTLADYASSESRCQALSAWLVLFLTSSTVILVAC